MERVPSRGTWRWSNVPIPESLAVPLIAGILMHIAAPTRLLPGSWARHAFGWLLFVVAALLGGWAVRTVGQLEISNSTKLVSTGPYAHSRHPMYVAWAVGYLGVALIMNALWPLVFLPAGLIATHLVILREERQLENRYGEDFIRYTNRVRRYF